jgi:hypothetical protein
MENSPLRFLDNDVSIKLNDEVKKAKTEIDREFHIKIYKEVSPGCMSGKIYTEFKYAFYESYIDDHLPEDYNKVVQKIKNFIVADSIKVDFNDMIPFYKYKNEHPDCKNVVKELARIFDMCFSNSSISAIQDVCGHCYNGSQLYDISYNEDNCMCDLCREERIGTDYCYYCNYYKRRSDSEKFKDQCICKK